MHEYEGEKDMAKFCGKCGTKLDEATGLCPNCDIEKIRNNNDEITETNVNNSKINQILNKKEINKRRKLVKEVKRPLGKKICVSLLKFFLISLLVLLVGVGVVGTLVYFGKIDIPEVRYIMKKNGIEPVSNVVSDPLKDNYIPSEESIKFDNEENIYYADNELIVIFNTSVTESQIKEVVHFLQGEIVGTVPALNMYQIQIPGSSSLTDLDLMAERLMSDFNCVSYATYDSAIPDVEESVQMLVPNDPWNEDVDPQDWIDSDVDGSNWWLEAIEVQGAWSYNDQFSMINIGISDSSFDVGHEDLKNKCSFANEILESRNVVTPWWNDFDFDTWSIRDQENYHGTHVAGIIGAEGNNNKGITGLVSNCHLLLAPYYMNETAAQYLWWDSSTYANLAYLVNAGAKVVNYSQGKTNFLTVSNSEYSEKFIEREGNLAAVSIARLLEDGYDFIVVQAAGNGIQDEENGRSIAVDALQNGWFACVTNNSITASDTITIKDVLDRIIIVGAAEQNENGYMCTDFSNFGFQVDIFAPGKEIYSTIPGEVFTNFQFWGAYGEEQGTSMSAPIVTGVCALTWSANTSLTGADVKKIVCNNTKNVAVSNPDTTNKDTYPMVNAKLAVEMALNYKQNQSVNGNVGQYDFSNVPDNAVELNGHYYYLYNGGIASSYEEALQYCNDKGGYLATLTTKEENDFVFSYITQQNCTSAYFGLSDAENEGTWEWCTGEEVSYTNWHSGEPNGGYSSEDCGLFYYKYTDGTWNDGDFGNHTANSGSAFICEWGSYSSRRDSETENESTTSEERDIVLVLDVSGSMSGTPLEETKKASANFVNTILKEDASIGIVTYNGEADRVSDFSMNKSTLQNVVSNLYDGGGTNIEAGLKEAQSMLNGSNAKKKIIVLMSDGEPNDGKQGDELVAYADEIKETGVFVYTIGFFENLGEKSSAQLLMEQIASDGCHYEVASADELVFFFEDMADQINGQKYIYVRIACPVDVSVTCDGQTLSSSEDDLNLRTDFGTLTFEENSEEGSEGIDDRVKVLRLKEGVDYDLELVGTGHGIMNYTIGFMDDDGEYSDLRKFENVKITRRTQIDTVAAVSSESVLNIDEDGDGKYDLKLCAEENGYGEEVKTPDWIIYAIVGAGALILIDVVIIIAFGMRKKRKVDN